MENNITYFSFTDTEIEYLMAGLNLVILSAMQNDTNDYDGAVEIQRDCYKLLQTLKQAIKG